MTNNNSTDSIIGSFQLIAETMIEGGSKKIIKKQYQEAFDVLGNCIFPQGRIPFNEKEMKLVGIDFVVAWIVENWETLNDIERKEFCEKLSDSLGSRQSNRRLFVVLAHELLNIDEKNAVIPLSVLFKQPIKSLKEFPLNKKIIFWIRTLFLQNNNDIAKMILTPDVVMADKIALYSIAAAFVPLGEPLKKAGVSAQLAVIKWVCKTGLHLQLPDYLVGYVRDSELSLDRNVKSVQNYLPDFPKNITFGHSHSVQPDQPILLHDEKQLVSEKDGQITVPPTLNKDEEFVLNKYLKRVQDENRNGDTILRIQDSRSKPISSIKVLETLQQYIQESKEKSEQITNEKNKLEKECVNLEDEIEGLRGKASLYRNQVEQKSREINLLKGELSSSEKQVETLVQERESLCLQVKLGRQNFDNELQRFSEKIDNSEFREK